MKWLPFLLLMAFFVLLSPAAVGTEDSSDKPAAANAEGMKTKKWNVDVDFVTQVLSPMGEQKKILYPKGAYARYNAAKKELVVFNTPEQLKVISELIADYNKRTSPNGAAASELYKQIWRVPKALIESLDKDMLDFDFTALWKADPQISLTMISGIRFGDVEGASASYKGGKLTIIHTKERLHDIQEYLGDGMSVKCTQVGKMTPVSAKDAELLKPKKHKNKIKTKEGKVLDIDKLYRIYEGANPESGHAQ